MTTATLPQSLRCRSRRLHFCVVNDLVQVALSLSRSRSLLLLPCQARRQHQRQRRRQRRAMWSMFVPKLILCALHTPLQRLLSLSLSLSHYKSKAPLPLSVYRLHCRRQFLFLNYFEKCFENCVKCTTPKNKKLNKDKKKTNNTATVKMLDCWRPSSRIANINKS